MYEINRKTTIFWKLNPSTFEKINREVVGSDYQRLGSAGKPVNTMLSLGSEMRMIMPVVLAADPDSSSSNWDKLLAGYWHSLSIQIPAKGKDLQTGFRFDLSDGKRKRYLDELVKEKNIKSDKALAEYVMGNNKDKPNVPEEEKWKYGEPIEPEQYMWWRFALIHREVANSVIYSEKSTMIRFYLHSDEEQKAIQKRQLDISRKAIDVYNNIMAVENPTRRVSDIVNYLMQDQLSLFNNMSDDDKLIKMIGFVKDSPDKVVAAAEDKSLPVKVNILKFMEAGVLRKVGGTELIVDGSDSSVVIGDGMDDAVAFITNSKNKEIVEQYKAKLKSLV